MSEFEALVPISSLIRAASIASQAHAGQTYGDGEPYTKHLLDVVRVLTEYGADEELQIAGWLHDTLEDTALSTDTINKEFGPQVECLVWRVTDPAGCQNRSERHTVSYPRIRNDPRAVMLKLADRIANIEASREKKSSLLEMYRKEQPEFEMALRRDGEFDPMWERLSEAFR